MRKLLAVILMTASVGCVSSTTKQIVARQAARSDAYVQKMDAGQTTRAQDQEFIHKNRKAWAAENFDLNGVALPADIAATMSSDPASLTNAGQ